MSSQPSIAELRRLTIQRARGYCEYCYSQAAFSPSPFEIEHIFPKTLGGITELQNLALACSGCNLSKGVRTTGVDEMTGLSTPLYHPRRDQWAQHFAWSKSGLHIVPLSATGRVTVALLKLNRPNVVNLREVLATFGKHPPIPIDD